MDTGIPNLNGSTAFSLVSTREVDPPAFTVSFNVTNLPPTYVECFMDDVAVANSSQSNITRKVVQAEQPISTRVTVFMKQRSQGVLHCHVSTAGVNGVFALADMTTDIKGSIG